jgi:predicted dehydrogenase
MRVAQIGCGSWGANVLRELAAHPRVDLVLVVDPRLSARTRATALVPGVPVTHDTASIGRVRADAAVVVTPGPVHAEVAEIALRQGLHVFIEKPMTTSLADAARLRVLARERGLVGMVGHLMLHHPAVRALIGVLRSESIGAPVRVRCDRASIAGSRDVDGSIFWSLAPHDLSMVRAIDPTPIQVVGVEVLRATAGGLPLEAEVRLRTAAGLPVRIGLSRVADRKTRRMLVECEHGVVTFDDVVKSSKVVVVSRRGDHVQPVGYDQTVSPLEAEVDAFVRAVLDGAAPHADFEEGAEVVEVIEAMHARCDGLWGRGVRRPVPATVS